MTEMGHEERFPPTRLNAGCGSERGDRRDAPQRARRADSGRSPDEAEPISAVDRRPIDRPNRQPVVACVDHGMIYPESQLRRGPHMSGRPTNVSESRADHIRTATSACRVQSRARRGAGAADRHRRSITGNQFVSRRPRPGVRSDFGEGSCPLRCRIGGLLLREGEKFRVVVAHGETLLVEAWRALDGVRPPQGGQMARLIAGERLIHPQMENARLLTETGETLAQQTATAEVLQAVAPA
jgi:hypothetical protein